MKARRSLRIARVFFVAPLLLGGWTARSLDPTSSRSARGPLLFAQAQTYDAAANAAIKDASTIAHVLRGLNAAGLQSAATDPHLQNAVSNLRNYLAAAGTAGWQVLRSTGNPTDAVIAAAVAGQLQDYKSTAADVIDGVRAFQAGNNQLAATKTVNVGLNILAGRLANDIAQQAGTKIGTPTVVLDAAQVGARFIMAYESGALQKAAPNGFAPLLDKNPTTKNWLANIDAYIYSGSIKQTGTARTGQQASGPTGGNIPGPQSAAPAGPQPNKGSSPPAVIGPISKPVGGISLSKAAAERMPLNLTLDGAYIDNHRIILSGPKNMGGSIDAALFLTALRAACQDSDPYFSLDPDNMAAWLAETKQAQDELSETIKRDTAWRFPKRIRRDAPSILKFQTISASRDFPMLWNSMLAKYPDLKSRLIFQPEWLRQTRFGEIMYRADVLLKELAGGATALGESRFRATNIDGYRSATERIAAVGLLYQYNGWTNQENPEAGGRIWYDLTESSDTLVGKPEEIPEGKSELRNLLESRGLLARSVEQSPPQRLAVNGRAIDLSDVYPRMFVRARDPVTFRDSTVRFPGLDDLVAQANQTPERYVAAYTEYERLVEVFRAYLVAIRAIQTDSGLCSHLPSELLDAEKVHSPLPVFHPTDFTMTMGWYEYQDGGVRRAIGAPGALFQGGVSIGANRFLENMPAGPTTVTPIITTLTSEAARPIQAASWTNDGNRQFVAFEVTDDITTDDRRVASISPPLQTTDANRDPLNGDIENAPPSRPLPPEFHIGGGTGNVPLLMILLAVIATVVVGSRLSKAR